MISLWSSGAVLRYDIAETVRYVAARMSAIPSATWKRRSRRKSIIPIEGIIGAFACFL